MKNLLNKIKVLAPYVFIALGAIVLFNWVVPRKNVTVSSGTLTPTVTYIKDGVKRSEYEAVVLENKEFKEQVNSLRKQLKGKHKISSVSDFTVKIDTEYIEVPVYVDSFKENYFIRNKSDYISLWATVNTKTETGNIGLEIIDTLNYIESKRNHLFKKDEHIITLSSKSGQFDFLEGKTITRKEKRAIITGGIGPYYDPFRNQVGASIFIGFPIFTIKK